MSVVLADKEIAEKFWNGDFKTETLKIQKEIPKQISIEVNLQRLPLVSFSHDKSWKREWKRSYIDKKTGVRMTGEFLVKGDPEIGVLRGILDHKLMFAVIYLWNEQGRPDNGEVHFTFGNLSKLLNKKASGGDAYRQIRESLVRLSEVRMRSNLAFYQKSKGEHVVTNSAKSERMGISFLSDLECFTADERGFEKAHRAWDYNIAKIHSFFLDNLRNHYTKNIELNKVLKFRCEKTISLYQLINVHRRPNNTLEYTLKKLQEDVPISEAYHSPSQIKKDLKRALEELVSHGVIETYGYEKSEKKPGNALDKTKLCMKLRPIHEEKTKELTLFDYMDDKYNPLEEGIDRSLIMAQLEKHAISKKDQFEILKYEDEKILEKLGVTILTRKYKPQNVKNFSKFLTTALKEDWQLDESIKEQEEAAQKKDRSKENEEWFRNQGFNFGDHTKDSSGIRYNNSFIGFSVIDFQEKVSSLIEVRKARVELRKIRETFLNQRKTSFQKTFEELPETKKEDIEQRFIEKRREEGHSIEREKATYRFAFDSFLKSELLEDEFEAFSKYLATLKTDFSDLIKKADLKAGFAFEKDSLPE